MGIVKRNGNTLLDFYNKILIGYNITILNVSQTYISYKIEKNGIDFDLILVLFDNDDRIKFIKICSQHDIKIN